MGKLNRYKEPLFVGWCKPHLVYIRMLLRNEVGNGERGVSGPFLPYHQFNCGAKCAGDTGDEAGTLSPSGLPLPPPVWGHLRPWSSCSVNLTWCHRTSSFPMLQQRYKEIWGSENTLAFTLWHRVKIALQVSFRLCKNRILNNLLSKPNFKLFVSVFLNYFKASRTQLLRAAIHLKCVHVCVCVFA